MFRFPTYINNGKGRDTYISSNNGGFSTYYQPMISNKEQFIINKYSYHKDFSVQKPINKYVSDGNGRDYYIYNDILAQHSHQSGITSLPSILRKGKPSVYTQLRRNYSPSKFERTLLGRLFYGKCKGMKDRQLSPKVIFAKKKTFKDNLDDAKLYENDKSGDKYKDSKENIMTEINTSNSENLFKNEIKKDKRNKEDKFNNETFSFYGRNRVLTDANEYEKLRGVGRSFDCLRNMKRMKDNENETRELIPSFKKSSILKISPKYKKFFRVKVGKDEEDKKEKDICNKVHQIFGYRTKYRNQNFDIFKNSSK